MSVAWPVRRWRGIAGAAVLGLASAYGWAGADRATLTAPEPTPILYDRGGAFLSQVGHEARDGVAPRIDYGYWTVDPLPDRVVRATLALEDRRFWSHPGVDPLAISRALWRNLSTTRRRSGASTI